MMSYVLCMVNDTIDKLVQLICFDNCETVPMSYLDKYGKTSNVKHLFSGDAVTAVTPCDLY